MATQVSRRRRSTRLRHHYVEEEEEEEASKENETTSDHGHDRDHDHVVTSHGQADNDADRDGDNDGGGRAHANDGHDDTVEHTAQVNHRTSQRRERKQGQDEPNEGDGQRDTEQVLHITSREGSMTDRQHEGEPDGENHSQRTHNETAKGPQRRKRKWTTRDAMEWSTVGLRDMKSTVQLIRQQSSSLASAHVGSLDLAAVHVQQSSAETGGALRRQHSMGQGGRGQHERRELQLQQAQDVCDAVTSSFQSMGTAMRSVCVGLLVARFFRCGSRGWRERLLSCVTVSFTHPFPFCM